MKSFFLTLTLILALCLSSVNAQKVIDEPKHGISTAPYLNLTKIELRDSTTIMSFLVNFTPGNWISIPKETYIQNPVDNEKLYVVTTEGIPFNEKYWMPDSGQVAFKLFFPPVSEDWETIDYGEGNEGGNWAIYDIRLKPHKSSSVVPKEFKGNWYSTTNGEWELGLLDTKAIYKNQVWEYKDSDFTKAKGYVTLVRKEKEARLYLKKGEEGKLLAGEDSKKLKLYASKEILPTFKSSKSTSIYTSPIFNYDSVTFNGFIAGYSPRVGFKTFVIYVNDLLTGDQSSKTIRVSENGEFSIKIPYYYPHSVYLRSPFANGSLFLEPGKNLFVMYDGQDACFMGELGLLNQDLSEVQHIESFNYRDMQEKILDMTPQDYKIYISKARDNGLQRLNELAKEKGLDAKACQIKELNINYRYGELLLSYEMNFSSAYREKYKIPYTQRELPIEIENPPHDYYDFITNDFVNNPIAVISDSYNSFVNRFKYSNILSDNKSISLTTIDIANELIKSGEPLTTEDEQLIEKLKEFETSEAKKKVDAYSEKYSDLNRKFYTKYEDETKDLRENSKDLEVSITMMADHLKIKGIEITEEEQELVNAYTDFNEQPWGKELQRFYTENGEAFNKFHQRHQDFVSKFFAEKRITTRNRLLKDSLGIESGLIEDVMNTQDFLYPITSQMSPVSQKELDNFKKTISSPFIAEYSETINNQSIAKIEANKNKSGYTKNEVPKTEADQLFEAMMEKFKGKVVYVDFWASWCGPCRSGIESIKPLKEELKDEDVVFVYITNQTTPEKTWENMIPDIKGEHFRVSDDEWNFLSEKFNISGIPHYVLVDKTSQVVKPKMGHYGNGALKQIILEQINKQE